MGIRARTVALALALYRTAALRASPARCGARPAKGLVTLRSADDGNDVGFEAASFKEAVSRGTDYRREQRAVVAKAERLEAREAARPRPGAVGMRNARVQPDQEPQNELVELVESGSWALLGGGALALRLLLVGLFFGAVAYGFVDNLDTYNELVDVPLASRLAQSTAVGASTVSFVAVRALLRLLYIQSRLLGAELQFEETGWADGFRLEKPPDAAFRDKLLCEETVEPRLPTVKAAAALSIIAFVASAAAVLAGV
ncbi:hypothetical protein M885DRAFT_504214 [Pelagophyceae sp. CCMP2097]|nr:hypothetical protein M885DRAFT_504214 [Pelagophyceae sp. CCMP2097]